MRPVVPLRSHSSPLSEGPGFANPRDTAYLSHLEMAVLALAYPLLSGQSTIQVKNHTHPGTNAKSARCHGKATTLP